MTQSEIANALRQHITISEEDLQYFFKTAPVKKLRKNEFLVNAGDLDTPLHLIKSGYLMTYFYDQQEHPHVLQFGSEMWWTGDLDAFFKQKESFYTIKAMVPSEVYQVSRSLFEEMSQRTPQFDKYFRIIFQNALISHQRRIIRNISFTAEEKYLEFVKEYPKLELIIPQKYIASYIGITPEFLSKLRRKLAGK
jgi:CRP-like cAMP-binding protein